MTSDLKICEVPAYPVLVARAPFVAGKVPQTMMPLLGRVWEFIRKLSIKNDGHNIAIYRNGAIEAGVRVLELVDGDGDVYCTTTPSGRVATVTHVGPYQRMHESYSVLDQYLQANGLKCAASWELYGHWNDDESKLTTDLYYLLK